MDQDRLEFAVTQYLDGSMPPLERAAFEDRLKTDAEARRLLEEHRRLDELLNFAAAPLPEVDWNKLQTRISAAVEQAEAPAVRTFRLADYFRSPVRVAAAASVLLVMTAGLWLLSRSGSTTGPAPVVSVYVLSVEQSEGIPVNEISVGPSPALAQRPVFNNVVISRPSRVVIASGDAPAQDNFLSY